MSPVEVVGISPEPLSLRFGHEFSLLLGNFRHQNQIFKKYRNRWLTPLLDNVFMLRASGINTYFVTPPFPFYPFFQLIKSVLDLSTPPTLPLLFELSNQWDGLSDWSYSLKDTLYRKIYSPSISCPNTIELSIRDLVYWSSGDRNSSINMSLPV